MEQEVFENSLKLSKLIERGFTVLEYEGLEEETQLGVDFLVRYRLKETDILKMGKQEHKPTLKNFKLISIFKRMSLLEALVYSDYSRMIRITHGVKTNDSTIFNYMNIKGVEMWLKSELLKAMKHD